MSDKCNEKVYNEGTSVFMIADMDGDKIEKWVQMIAEKSGQPVDWFWYGGRACIKALGDLHQVIMTIEDNLPTDDTQDYPVQYMYV
jgi:hypothetical protein